MDEEGHFEDPFTFSHEAIEPFCVFLLLFTTPLVDFRGVIPTPTIYKWKIDGMRVYGIRNWLRFRIILKG